jgi:hypothetical protein
MQNSEYSTVIRVDDKLYRFVIRDRSGAKPSIHGYGQTRAEAERKVLEILAALSDKEIRAA